MPRARRVPIWTTAGFVFLAVLAGCGGGNELSGSIGESFELDFDLVRVRKQNETLIIEYIKLVSGGENKALKLVVEGNDLLTVDGSLIDMTSGLAIDDELFAKAVSIDRVASTGADFPDIEDGRMYFSALEFQAAGRVEGDFDIVFDNGRTLAGSFMGELTVVDMS